MKKIVLTLMLCLSCASCFANEVPVEARMGKQFVCTIHKVASGFIYSYDEFDATYKEMHELGYIPHKVIDCSYNKGITGRLYITWIRTHIGGYNGLN